MTQAATSAPRDTAPWPLRFNLSAAPCPCWAGPAAIHSGHCCFRDREICHPIPETMRVPRSCGQCGHEVTAPGWQCGLCGTALDSRPIRQVVYRYQTGDSGTGPFAVWRLGAREITLYSAEGRTLAVLPVQRPDRAHAWHAATAAAPGHLPIIGVQESGSTYPA